MNEMTRENARKIDFYGSTLDECVNSLLKFQQRGESVVVDFNGHKLYSCDVTMDGAYQEVLGMTKAEHDRKREEWRKEYQEREAREKAEAEAKIPDWIEKGKAYIYPERVGKWKECVEARAGDLYHGMDLDSALALMEKLESGATMEEVKEMFDEQGHSGASAGMVRSILFHFAKRGPEFYESTAWRDLSDEDKKVVEDKKKENKLLESIHDSKDIKSNLLGAMSMTQSWLTLEDLQTVLPPEQYQELVTTVRSGLEQYYAKLNLPDVTQEEIEKEIAEEVAGKVFEIGVDDKGSFILQEFALSRDKLTRPINPSQLDATKLASVVEKAMQKHLDYDRFHTNKYLKAEQIPQTLEYYINVAKEYQSRDIETPEDVDRATDETVEVQAEQRNEIAEQKASAVPVNINYRYGNTIESAVKTLEDYKARGESVVIDFNGHKLYSCDVTMDSAYMEITGKTKAEFDEAQAKWRKEYQEREAREEAEAKAKIPAWVEKGEAFIYPERMEKWKECVEARAGDLYHGMDLDSALALMEKLESGATMEEVKEMFDEQGHSGASAGMVRRMMFHFAKRGPEFYESTAWGELSEEDKKLIEDKKRENAELDELHKTDSTKEVPAERRAEEKGIVDSSSEKAQLTSEIGDIEQQLEELRAKEAELKKALEEKQSKLNGLEEK